ncbi:Phenylalanine-specific permease [Serratia fonticola]|uniref:Phenylalanine-specific permease n=1 Tax=Serratia fonticola TaxID=47917 RepID=A0A4U9VXI4_SERFO|nr:Phenylalanine-specific permease [Serratia fonticola]
MHSDKTTAHDKQAARKRWLDSHESGYHKSMGKRQIQMIAIGGSIGTGLFLGTGARLQMAGPALALVYLVCGVFSFFILRALGELVLHRPSSGSFRFLCTRIFSVKRPPTLQAGCTFLIGR